MRKWLVSTHGPLCSEATAAVLCLPRPPSSFISRTHSPPHSDFIHLFSSHFQQSPTFQSYAFTIPIFNPLLGPSATPCCHIFASGHIRIRKYPSFEVASLPPTTPLQINIQPQSCQTFTTAPLTMLLPCSRTLTPLTTTTVARAAVLVSLRRRLPTVNSSSRLSAVLRNCPRPLPLAHT